MEFKLKDMGALQFFLGMEFLKIGDTGIHILSQQRYTCDLLKQTNMHLSKPATAPMASTTKLNLYDGSFDDKSIYQSTIGALLYLVNTLTDIYSLCSQ